MLSCVAGLRVRAALQVRVQDVRARVPPVCAPTLPSAQRESESATQRTHTHTKQVVVNVLSVSSHGRRMGIIY